MNEDTDETTPLVQSHQIQVESVSSTDLHPVEYNAQEEEPPPYSSFEEKMGGRPPPYYHQRAGTPTPSEGSSVTSSLIPHINCRVCQTVLSVEGKLHLHVIKCHSCGEATPIRPAPTGKKYVRCPCNCLLICKATSQRIVCPRQNCKRVISLGPVNVTNLTHDEDRSSRNPTRRIVCAHCNTSFLWVRPEDTYDACPHCGQYSSFGPGYRRRKIKVFAISASIMIIVASIAMALLMHFHESKSELSEEYYYIFGGLYLISLIFILFAVRYSCMSVSIIQRPSYLQYT